MEGKILTEKLLAYAREFLHLKELDVIYTRNLLLREFGLKEPAEDADVSDVKNMSVPDELVAAVESYARENGLCEEGEENLYSTYIFGILTPKPSEVNETFYRLREEKGINAACAYFYDLCIKNNYIQKTAIDRNLKWEYKDGSNILEITINLSKPEKDNKEIAKLLVKKAEKPKYPKCLLCKENEGFEGSLSHPARENIRTVSMKLAGEDWFVQYSPYAYYDEHCIAISKQHVPMNVNAKTVEKLADFVDIFPNYMIGSNASLPIVGGSILNHEHFQGGVHLMPMHKAKIALPMKSEKYPDVSVGILDWYNSVVRMQGKNRAHVVALAGEIVEAWKNHSDEENDILAKTGDTPHNASSPIIRMVGEEYSVDLILRNNRTNEQYPDGIFHAHPEYHNIKKEGIGLIEAMGLFILPGRLKKQLAMIADILCGKEKYDEAALNDPENYLYVHRDMIREMKASFKGSGYEEAHAAVISRVNETCKHILDNTAVFKKDEKGVRGFKNFLKKIGITEA